jgi:parallel beta-helix repeat protein
MTKAKNGSFQYLIVQRQNRAACVLAVVILIGLTYQNSALNLVNANPHFQPPIDPGYYYIKSDGSISPAEVPIQRQGNTYRLTSNITGHTIWIEHNGVILDGAGYTVKNNRTGYEIGIMLNCTTSVTVKNLRVESFSCAITAQRQIFDISPYLNQPTLPENPYPKSTSNTIIDCNLQNNGVGILIEDSTKNRILNNTIRGNSVGIKMDRFQEPIASNIIQNNLIENNGKGILLEDCAGNTITTNKITKNSVCGLDMFWSSNNAVHYNLIAKNEIGILINGGAGGNTAEKNTINTNQIIENNQWGIRLNGSQTDNQIYANNFIDNNLGKGLQVSIPIYMEIDGKVYSGQANIWNDNSTGNYWSDYQTRYPNATKNGGVWDNPFYINEKNIDQHSLTNPLNLETPILEEEQVNVNSPTPPYTAALAILAACIIAVVCLLVYRKHNKKSLNLQ